MVVSDQRGKHSQQRKVAEALSEIKKHIESFPSFKSHYSQKDTDKKYLSPSLSIAEMFRLYFTHCNDNNLQPQKEHMYQNIFNEQFNLSFHLPSKDTYKKCDGFEASLITANDNERRIIEEKKRAVLAKSRDCLQAKKQGQSSSCSFKKLCDSKF